MPKGSTGTSMGGSSRKLKQRTDLKEIDATDYKLAKKTCPEKYYERFKREVGFSGPLIPLSF